ncbi:DNA repair exonuclease SbcCD nuclease subunit [Lampropedia hyalina DSM 16112]|jgi:DNA repair exonuclease SbcCD nuclease subunit|uniref:DNA repair exonuclease SbcCD nuclease subunit n=1 Tax=Lampropedia hyalina DSM 16112 TaxID=1122156 RepID=A0A1M4Y8G2_9BURK|nr:DNA repair exonuclease [Lampropedia hyalina]SHF02005.1 DNA repair exonuclease SbcCD nuclease subunit [Lampropedia hyalina DSM 16112]
MPRILHTADWQIGRQYGRFAPEDAAALAEARFSTIERVAALAVEQQVQAVLVAGDVFDAQTVSDRTIRRLFNALQGFAGPWVVIPGNHDAALAESVWSRARRLAAIPPHVHVACEPQVLPFPDLGIAVLAAPLTQRQTHSDLTEWFDAAETASGLLRIGLAHGSVQGLLAQDIDSPNPIAADRARRARLDYLALGDWHGRRQIDGNTWYSGTPEQDRFKDNDAGHVLLVDWPDGEPGPCVQSHAVGHYHWQQWRVVLAVESDLEPWIERLKALPDHAVLHLELTGHLDLAARYRLQQALSVAQGRCRSLQWDESRLRILPTDQEVAALHADGYLGEVIHELREQQQAEGTEAAEVAREALSILAGLLREQEGRT